jgi:hypothetical protein
MNAKWQDRLIQVLIWLAIEITLNLLGLDNIADYSEFVFQQELVSVTPTHPAITSCFSTPAYQTNPMFQPYTSCLLSLQF